MHNFKIGDRVKVYCVNLGYMASTFKGTVIGFNPSGALKVMGDHYPNLKPSIVHPKQCRKLVKRKKHKFYILKDRLSQLGDIGFLNEEGSPCLHPKWPNGWVKFVEIKNPKS